MGKHAWDVDDGTHHLLFKGIPAKNFKPGLSTFYLLSDIRHFAGEIIRLRLSKTSCVLTAGGFVTSAPSAIRLFDLFSHLRLKLCVDHSPAIPELTGFCISSHPLAAQCSCP